MPVTDLRLLPCETCHRKRRCRTTRASIGVEGSPRRYRLRRCSQGHVWYVEIPTIEKINEVMARNILPALAREMWRPHPLLEYIRRR